MNRSRAVLAVCLVCGSGAALPAQTGPERLIEAGHWKRARTMVEARFREAPADPLANFLLSQVRNAFGDHDSPLALAEKAVALDGRTAKYHRQVAECLGVMAQHANMLQQVFLARRFRHEIDAALSLDPRDMQAWRDLMEFYLLAPAIVGGDPRQATETAARLRAIDPVAGLLAQARLAAFRKQPAEAEACLRRAAEAQPPSYRARVALAEFHLSGVPPGFDDARKPAEEAVALDPSRVDAYAILAEVDAARERWAELDAVLSSAAKEVPDDLVPFYRAAVRLLACGSDLPRAERYLRTYLAQPPEGNAPPEADARAQLRLVLAKQGRTAVRANASSMKEAAKAERPR
jgi:tetratricopeptide (TPR) repeat protein